jgi:hypothetical protein
MGALLSLVPCGRTLFTILHAADANAKLCEASFSVARTQYPHTAGFLKQLEAPAL